MHVTHVAMNPPRDLLVLFPLPVTMHVMCCPQWARGLRKKFYGVTVQGGVLISSFAFYVQEGLITGWTIKPYTVVLGGLPDSTPPRSHTTSDDESAGDGNGDGDAAQGA